MRKPTLTARIGAALDPLRARLRRDEIQRVARRIVATGLPRDAGRLALALALVDQADHAADERRHMASSLERLADALATHGRSLAPALLDAHLAERAARRRDRRILARGIDTEGVAERDARELGRIDGTRELCLVAAGTLAGEAFAAARLDDPAARAPSALAPEARLAARLVEHGADGGAPWTVRLVALDAARTVLRSQPWPATPSVVNRLERLAERVGDNCWLQIAAVRALGAADAPRARVVARVRVAHARSGPDDVLVRARLARVLTGELHDPGAAAALGQAARESSEHLRQSVARACAESGDPACRQILARLADAAEEASPRVRAVAALAHAERASGAAGPTERMPAARALAGVLLFDPHPLPQAVAAAAAAERTGDASDAEVRDILLTALEQARGRAGVIPPVANEVARAAERAALRSGRLAILRTSIAGALADVDEEEAVRVEVDPTLDNDDIGRVLAELAQRDFGLYAERKNGAIVVRRGDRSKRRAWRLLHELARPTPGKRPGHTHTLGRVFDEPLRAHPGGLAEVAPTRVPGERVMVEREGGWGAYLPLVDDFLSLDGEARIFSEHGATVIHAPSTLSARLAARTQLTLRYAELAELRLRSLGSPDGAGRGAYAAAVEELGFGIRFAAWDGGETPEHLRPLFAPSRKRRAGDSLRPVPIGPALALAPFALGGLPDTLSGAMRALGDGSGGGIAELALFAGAAGLVLAGRSLAIRFDIAACRAAVPMVIGGWGTRGKSGVERLKAGLFHGLGYEVVSKTTGCEATLLVGVPGRSLVEVPLYRPYEKATIWEQRDVLRFAGVRQPHVLLWECMALNPGYVDLLQRGWMRDDLSTITNAYPDHEDIQGPSGLDVARVIAGFTPARATLITAEDQMLPVIRERARQQSTRLCAVEPRAHELLPEDLLARFPYNEHPRNVALVMALAEELGIDPEMALVEMARNVLADIGGLRVYGPLAVAGRRLRFANGMSANERASAMDNWRRLGFHAHDANAEPGRWIVALVNNRADRGPRTLVFAEALVEEIAAHRLVLVGSNIDGLVRAIEAALTRRLAHLAGADVVELLAQMKIGAARIDAVLAELAAWRPGFQADAALIDAIETALAPASGESLAEAARAVDASGAPALLAERVDDAELVAAARASWTRRRAGAGLRAGAVGERAAATLRELFLERIVVPRNPLGGADEVLETVARACPPGVAVDVMGLMNIKGPGLAVVHAFEAAGRAVTDAEATADADPDTGAAAARRLRELDGVAGLVFEAAAGRLEERTPELGPDERTRLEGLARRLREKAAAARGLGAGGEPARGALSRFFHGVRHSFDHLASSGRRQRADRIFGDLARGRIAVERAARELAALCDEQRQ